MITKKAGCVLINIDKSEVAIIYRDHLNDYSFPKGHLEQNETFEECAIRETAEETKRDAEIIKNVKPYINEYTTPKGEKCKCYMYLAKDLGKSDNDSTDTHKTIWVPFNKVEELLTYPSLIKTWNYFKKYINIYIN